MTKIATLCRCGQNGVHISCIPKARFRCHCTKCQATYQADYADALTFRRGQVTPIDPDRIKWVRTMRPSPLVRGLCKSCERPILAQLYGVFSIIPTETLVDLKPPAVSCDIYYATRQKDLSDSIPKYHSALASYAGLTRPFLGVLTLPGEPL